MNALDLVKVGRAFGFSVPPRVNITVGGGKSNGKPGQKRKRNIGFDDDEEDGDQDEVDNDDDNEDGEAEEEVNGRRRQGKSRRMETLGKKKVQKEMYKKNRERKATMSDGQQWSR